METLKEAGILKAIGGNKIAITNWKEFAKIAGYDFGSSEYVAGLSAYNDALI